MSEQGWMIILLLVYASICDATTEHKSRPGGLTDARPADESTQKIAEEVILLNQHL